MNDTSKEPGGSRGNAVPRDPVDGESGSGAGPSTWVGAWGVFWFSLLLVGCWVFPRFWYTRQATDRAAVWYLERTNTPGWACTVLPLDRSAEVALAADSLFYAEYRHVDRGVVRLFTARRWRENPDEIGLFVHTPDRCWTASGWRLEVAQPEHVDLALGGNTIGVERRLFVHPSGARELVYFFGVVGGQGLPYRLDHNLSVARKLGTSGPSRWGSGIVWLVGDPLLWARLRDSFVNRRQLFGPKEFIRISTPVEGEDWRGAEERLRTALGELLEVRPVG